MQILTAVATSASVPAYAGMGLGADAPYDIAPALCEGIDGYAVNAPHIPRA
jgi:hypothetical protein